MAEQKVNELSTATPALTDYIMGMSGTAEYKALVSAVAKKIVEDYAGSTLAGSARSVKSAIDELNSNVVAQKGALSVADFNTLDSTGIYFARAQGTTLNAPNPSVPGRFYVLLVFSVVDNSGYTEVVQIAFSGVAPRELRFRIRISNTNWTSWTVLSGTVAS